MTAHRMLDFANRQEKATHSGSARAVERQHSKGKRTARERLDLLLDPGSFVESDALTRHRSDSVENSDNRPYGDGVVTGRGLVDGRMVCVFAQDFTVFGGSLGETHGQKLIKTIDLAIKNRCPIVGINDSGGARIQDGVVSLAYYAELGRRNTLASGLIPQISMIMGPCAGGAVYSPAITDFTVVVDRMAHMFVTGPEVVAAVGGTRLSIDDLGSGQMNTAVAGNVHYLAEDETTAAEWVRALLSYLPSSNADTLPVIDRVVNPAVTAHDRELDDAVPESCNQVYDMYDVIDGVVDDGEMVEIQSAFAPNIICGFARIGGMPTGIVANQPACDAGVLDVDASEKAARFVRFCDCFNIPVLTFVDVPGYLPGVQQERLGIVRRGAKLAYAYAEATVPKVTVVVRKAYGGGYAAMGSKHLGADINLAWPTAQIAVMGETAAVSILGQQRIREATERGDAHVVREELAEEYRVRFATPYAAAERGYIDAVIQPGETRVRVTTALRLLRTKRAQTPQKKHGNIPL